MRGGTIARTTLVAIRAKLASGFVATDERTTGSVCEPIVCVRSKAKRNSLYDDMKANDRVVRDCHRNGGQQPGAQQKVENNRFASEFEASERVGGERAKSHVHESYGERDDRAVLECRRHLTRLLRDPAAKRSTDIQ